jgi:hypothetical protein
MVATSTAVKHVFLQGQQLLSFTCNHLLPSSIRAFLCLGSWSSNNLIGVEEVKAALKDKKEGSDLKRKREGQQLSDLDNH